MGNKPIASTKGKSLMDLAVVCPPPEFPPGLLVMSKSAMNESAKNEPSILLGEFRRNLDERFRLSIPSELADPLAAGSENCILAKERPGCLSLWNATRWQARLDAGVNLVKGKLAAGRLDDRVDEVLLLGRLLSTRHKLVQLAGRGRLLIPEGFREFLAVEPGGEVFVIGAAACVELWRPDAWLAYLEQKMPEFRQLFDRLSS